jgi:hypothetical protein
VAAQDLEQKTLPEEEIVFGLLLIKLLHFRLEHFRMIAFVLTEF